jgi:predicted DNA-binding transcriptional regulator AlpA
VTPRPHQSAIALHGHAPRAPIVATPARSGTALNDRELPIDGRTAVPPMAPAPPEIEFWSLRDVESAVKLKKSAIYARIARSEFPRPVKLSATVSVWVVAEVRCWMREVMRRR